MLKFRIISSALILLAAAEAHALTALPTPARSLSTSRQFVVYGPDVRLRGAICDLAEQTKRDLLAVLGEGDHWKIPIVISAEPPQANFPEALPASLNVSQTGGGVKLQLNLTIASDVSAPAVKSELLRALLVEMMYRESPNVPAGAAVVEPAPWLIEGIALQSNGGPGATTHVLAPLVAAKKISSLADFLRQQPQLLDSRSSEIYRAYSAALVELLTSGADGRRRLARFIRDLREGPPDPLANFAAHFPALTTRDSGLEEAWTNWIAQAARRTDSGLLGAAETAEALDRLSHITLPTQQEPAKKYSLEEFPQFVQTAAGRTALRKLSDELLLLQSRANALYRPIVQEYHDIVALLARGSTKHIAERLARARQLHAQLKARMANVDDYMNWFEATQLRTQSGLFADYLKTAESEKREPRRRDPISLYLDALEAQLGD